MLLALVAGRGDKPPNVAGRSVTQADTGHFPGCTGPGMPRPPCRDERGSVSGLPHRGMRPSPASCSGVTRRLSGGAVIPRRGRANVRRHFWLSRWGLLSAARGWKPGTLPEHPTRHRSAHSKDDLVQRPLVQL